MEQYMYRSILAAARGGLLYQQYINNMSTLISIVKISIVWNNRCIGAYLLAARGWFLVLFFGIFWFLVQQIIVKYGTVYVSEHIGCCQGVVGFINKVPAGLTPDATRQLNKFQITYLQKLTHLQIWTNQKSSKVIF